jgi:biotin-(acetyl-CoA carboxylase) ligase
VTDQEHDSTELLIRVLNQLQRQLLELSRAPKSVVRQMNELCLQRGKRLQIAQGANRLEGRCLGVAEDGALVLEIDGSPHAVYSGVVTSVEEA